MPERATVLEHVQLGVESVAGTLATVNRNILGWGIEIAPNVPSEVVRPEGQRFPTGVVNGKEWLQATLRMAFGYKDLPYLLNGLLKDITSSYPTTPSYNGTWTATITGTPDGGTFTLTYGGQTTAGIAYNATAGAVQSALVALTSVGTGNVTVTGGPGPGTPYVITFGGVLQQTVAALTASGAGLTGGTDPAIGVASTAATNTRRWLWTPSQSADDAVKTFSIEKGSSVGASRFTYGLFTDFDLSVTPATISASARLFGRAIEDGVSMSGSMTDIALEPVAVKEGSVWIGSSILGMTRMTRVLELGFSIHGMHLPVFTIDDSQSSYSADVAGEASLPCRIVLEQNSDAVTAMTDLRARSERFIRFQFIGSSIETGYVRMIRITMPFRYRNPARGDSGGVYAATFDIEGCYNSTLGSALEIEVFNDLASL